MLLEHWQVDHLLWNGHHIIPYLVLLWKGFVEKSLFSPMAICFVNPVGCHVTADHLHMPGQAFVGFFVVSHFCSVYKWIHSSDICHYVPHHLEQNVAIYVFSFHYFHEMCACTISLHIYVINILLLFHHSYHSLYCETAAQFYKITYNDSMCTHIQVFQCFPKVCSCYCMWILSIIG